MRGGIKVRSIFGYPTYLPLPFQPSHSIFGAREVTDDETYPGTLAELKENARKLCSRSAGFTFALLSALASATSGVFFKLADEMNVFEIIFLRGLATLIVAVTVTLYKRKPLLLVRNNYLWIAATGSCLCHTLYYLAMQNMNYGDAAAVFQILPILVGIVGHFYLKELYTICDTLVTVVMFLGVLLVIQPGFLVQLLYPNTYDVISDVLARNDTNATFWPNISQTDLLTSLNKSVLFNNTTLSNGIGSAEHTPGLGISREMAGLMSVGAAISCCFSTIFARRCGKIYLPTMLVQYNLILVSLSAILTTALDLWTLPSNLDQWIYLFCYILIYPLGHFAYLVAIRHATAALVTTVKVSDIPMSYCLQIVVLRHNPSVLSAVGAVLITVGSLVFSFIRYRREKEAKQRRKTMAVEADDGDCVEEIALTTSDAGTCQAEGGGIGSDDDSIVIDKIL
jgi:drug/metabolite transporter (DMT)-like permease